MKAVLISIRPRWCERIASGRKTVEVRKTSPKIETPFKCYIYCTKPGTKDRNQLLEIHGHDGKIRKANGKVIGDFVCYNIVNLFTENHLWVAEEDVLHTCLTADEIREYGNGASGLYGWHISDLKIYDKPKELSKFTSFCRVDEKRCASCEHYLFDNDEMNGYRRWCGVYRRKPLTRPPQSWYYVEENV